MIPLRTSILSSLVCFLLISASIASMRAATSKPPLSAIIPRLALPSIVRLRTGFLRFSYAGESVGRNSISWGCSLSRAPSLVSGVMFIQIYLTTNEAR